MTSEPGKALRSAHPPLAALQRLPRPIFLRSQDLSAGQFFDVHAHPWNQLVYATSGTLVVILEAMRYVITPDQAIWIPTGLNHASGSFCGAAFRSLYIDDALTGTMPKHCVVLSVPPFLRASIAELHAAEARKDDAAYVDHVNAMILAQLHRAPVQEFSLPWPRTPVLRKLCEKLYDDPADGRTTVQWCQELAITPRTLARRFAAEVGMSLRDWRRRLRLFRALEWLGAGRSVTQIAMDLGYSSPSAFTFMFRQETGCSPSDRLAKRPR